MNEQKEILFAKRDELKNSAKVLKAKDLTIAENLDALNKVLDEIEATDKAIDAIEKAEKIESQSATAVNSATESKDKFNSFGEFLNAVKVAGKTKDRVVDKRLVKDAIKGVNETTDADGGYAVQLHYARFKRGNFRKRRNCCRGRRSGVLGRRGRHRYRDKAEIQEQRD